MPWIRGRPDIQYRADFGSKFACGSALTANCRLCTFVAGKFAFGACYTYQNPRRIENRRIPSCSRRTIFNQIRRSQRGLPRFHVSTRNGEKVVLRIFGPLVGNITLADLGLEGRTLRLILENIAKPFGSILVTGPTGSENLRHWRLCCDR